MYTTHGEVSTKNYLLAGAIGAPPCGADGATGAPAGAWAGADCIGWAAGFAGADFDDMIEELLPLEDRCARVNEVSMKIMAAPVVSLFMKVFPPLAPKTV